MDKMYYYGIKVMESKDHANPRTHVCPFDEICDVIGERAVEQGGYIIERFKYTIREELRGGKVCKVIIGTESIG
jgi:hypothetical protein